MNEAEVTLGFTSRIAITPAEVYKAEDETFYDNLNPKIDPCPLLKLTLFILVDFNATTDNEIYELCGGFQEQYQLSFGFCHIHNV